MVSPPWCGPFFWAWCSFSNLLIVMFHACSWFFLNDIHIQTLQTHAVVHGGHFKQRPLYLQVFFIQDTCWHPSASWRMIQHNAAPRDLCRAIPMLQSVAMGALSKPNDSNPEQAVRFKAFNDLPTCLCMITHVHRMYICTWCECMHALCL